MQLGIVLVVLVAVGSVALTQAGAEFERVERRRTVSLAELVANSPLVRTRLEEQATLGATGTTDLATLAATSVTQSGVTSVTITDPDGHVIASSLGLRRGALAPASQPELARGSSWSGPVTIDAIDYLAAQSPVLSDDDDRLGTVVGSVIVTARVPSPLELLSGASGYLITYLGIASVLGIVGSWLLARRIKHQTLGLEPREIAALAEYREAILSGVAEGVIALDTEQRITLVNEIGRNLLDLPEDAVGQQVTDLGLPPRLVDVLTGLGQGSRDEVVLRRGRVLVLNQMSVTKDARELGSVTTLRDRTELADLERELGAFRSTTDLLRAQAHEFDNRLHTIAGLIQLGEHEQAARYVSTLSAERSHLDLSITQTLRDSTVAALVLAKVSAAAERRVQLRVNEQASLDPLPPRMAADVATVVGNLVDNAVDAAAGAMANGATANGEGAWVDLQIENDTDEVTITVTDSGPGVTPELATEVFTHGFTTKAAGAGERGIGLALTRRLCRQRGGDVEVVSDSDGTRFVARLGLR